MCSKIKNYNMLIFLFIFFGGNLSALEEPSYTVVKKYDDFEIRDYEPYLVAEVDINLSLIHI